MRASALRDRFLDDGYHLPVRVLSVAQAEAYRRRFEAFDESPRAAAMPDIHNDVYLFKPHLILKWADDLVHEPGVIDAAVSVLGDDILCWSAGLFRKAPHSQSYVSWHQDAVYYGLSPVDRVVRVWIALTPATMANGTMEFARGAHRLGLRPHRPADAADNLLTKGETAEIDIDRFERVPVELAAGEASMHHLHLPHASGANGTAEPRINLVVTYIAPVVSQAYGEDSAMLVRGEDRHGQFTLDPRPTRDFTPDAAAAHARAMRLRRQVFAAAAADNDRRERTA
ncbi:MAG: phytanoyl-CoA dioxygenase family protein [Hyphomicrobiales bacterium]|nr:phytanoyl-CoA dioxygenase family protein [Hyphomicrobiales bacterium]